MQYEDIILAYNIDDLLDIYEHIKDLSVYNLIMDMNTKSNDFIQVIMCNVGYYENIKDQDDTTTDYDYNYDS
jgi:hypothetical protein